MHIDSIMIHIYGYNPQNCCAWRAISQNNRTVFSTAVQFSQGIPSYRGSGKPNSAFTVIFCIFISLNFGLSVIGFGSEWSLPHRGGSQDSEIRVFHKKQQSFMSSAYIVCPECLSASADDHMTTNQPQVDYSSHLDEDFAVTQLLCSWAHTDPQLHLQNVLLIFGCEWILCFTASCNL